MGKQNKKENQKPKSKIYQLYELRDELKKSKNAILSKNESQKDLIKIIFDAKAEGRFGDLIQAFQDEWKNDNQNILQLNTRAEALQAIIELYEKQDETSELVTDIVTKLLLGLGLVYHNENE